MPSREKWASPFPFFFSFIGLGLQKLISRLRRRGMRLEDLQGLAQAPVFPSSKQKCALLSRKKRGEGEKGQNGVALGNVAAVSHVSLASKRHGVAARSRRLFCMERREEGAKMGFMTGLRAKSPETHASSSSSSSCTKGPETKVGVHNTKQKRIAPSRAEEEAS